MEPGDSVHATSGSYDKSKVLDVKPLRCLAPLFPSPPPFASQPSSQSPFVCAPPRGPLPTGFTPFYPFHDPSDSRTPRTPIEQIRRAVPATNPPPLPRFVDSDAGPSKKKSRKDGEEDVVEVYSEGEEFEELRSGGVSDMFTPPSSGYQFSDVGQGSSNGMKKPKSRNKVKRSSDIKYSVPDDDEGDGESVWKIRMKYDALRRRIAQLEDDKETKSGNKRADLRAGNIMMTKGLRINRTKRIGSVPGVEIGDIFFFRMELCLVGLHAPSMAGIDYKSVRFDQELEEETVAVSIVSSGGYEDLAEDKDVLIYSGQGGISVKKDAKEMTDQKLERGNLALENSLRRGNEVRVIRGLRDLFNPTGKVYVYDGLYKIHESWTEKGKSGYNVFKYKLLRIPGQPEAFGIWNSIQKWRSKVAARPGLILPDLTSGAEKLPVSLVNDIDDEKGPTHFTYSPTLIYPKSIDSVKPAVGCSCRAPCRPGDPKCSCGVKNGGQLPHTVNGILVIRKHLIYECGPACHCYPNCKNQVSQSGLKVRLEVFKTDDRGWGLRSWDSIRAGTFICEYAGKLVDKANVENGKEEDEDDNYVFDSTCDVDSSFEWNYMPELLYEERQDEERQDDSNETGKLPLSLIIDANDTGNVARFMNHSCSPNVFWQPVLYDHHDESFPHIMFYAMKHIPPMTELTYDYGIGGSHFKNANRRKKCLCRSLKCRGYFH